MSTPVGSIRQTPSATYTYTSSGSGATTSASGRRWPSQSPPSSLPSAVAPSAAVQPMSSVYSVSSGRHAAVWARQSPSSPAPAPAPIAPVVLTRGQGTSSSPSPPVPAATSASSPSKGYHQTRAKLAQLHADRAAAQLQAAEAEAHEQSLRQRLHKEQEQGEEAIARLVAVVAQLQSVRQSDADVSGSTTTHTPESPIELPAPESDEADEVAAAEARCASLRAESEDLQARICRTEQSLADLRTANARLRADQKRHESMVESEMERTQGLRERHAAIMSAHVGHVSSREAEVADLRKQVEDLTEDVATARCQSAVAQEPDPQSDGEEAGRLQATVPCVVRGGPRKEWPPSPRRALREVWAHDSPDSPDGLVPGGPGSPPRQHQVVSSSSSGGEDPPRPRPGIGARRFSREERRRGSVGFADLEVAVDSSSTAAGSHEVGVRRRSAERAPMEQPHFTSASDSEVLSDALELRIRRAFHRADSLSNADGFVSRRELAALLRHRAVGLGGVLDTSSSGGVDEEEWVSVFRRLHMHGGSAEAALEWVEEKFEEPTESRVTFAPGAATSGRAVTHTPPSTSRASAQIAERAASAFKRIDGLCQRDGAISPQELRSVLRQQKLAAAVLFADLDVDSSGSVTHSEWMSWFARMEARNESAANSTLEWIEDQLSEL